MYIVPNSTIRILKNVPINSDYIHTLWFSTLAEQTTYFQSKAKYTLNNNYYVNRDNVNEVQVDLSTANLVDCNYIMFRNQNHENKWIYAFIKEVRYKNEDNSVIVFEIDDIQTWLFNMTLKECFIERQHTTTDVIGENLIPEQLEQGDYVFVEHTPSVISDLRKNMSVIVLATFKNGLDTQGGIVPTKGNFVSDMPNYGNYPNFSIGMFSGLHVHKFTDPATLNNWFSNINSENLQDGIVAIYMFPDALATASHDTLSIQKLNEGISLEFNAITSLNGHLPKNKKMLTSPYVKFLVTDGSGSSIEYSTEYFLNRKPSFELRGITNSKPELWLIPLNYKGVVKNYDEAFSLGTLPLCAYATDAYKAYLAQNSVNIGSSLGSTIAGTGVAALAFKNPASSLFIANPITAKIAAVGMGVSLVSSVASIVGSLHSAKTVPPRSGGVESSGAFLTATQQFGFRFYNATCRKEFAEIVDSYFTAFGYPINRIQKPNMKARTFYTYVKTRGCFIFGELPSDSASNMQAIFDNGITFWDIKKCEEGGKTVGDYDTLWNEPV